MSNGKLAAPTTHWDEDLIFATLGNPVRRRILLSLAHKSPQPAFDLKMPRCSFDNLLKHLIVMRESGMVVLKADPTDGRRWLYALAPSIPVTANPDGASIDFGFCILRVHGK